MLTLNDLADEGVTKFRVQSSTGKDLIVSKLGKICSEGRVRLIAKHHKINGFSVSVRCFVATIRGCLLRTYDRIIGCIFTCHRMRLQSSKYTYILTQIEQKISPVSMLLSLTSRTQSGTAEVCFFSIFLVIRSAKLWIAVPVVLEGLQLRLLFFSYPSPYHGNFMDTENLIDEGEHREKTWMLICIHHIVLKDVWSQPNSTWTAWWAKAKPLSFWEETRAQH